ncbi:glycoside hydrolase family 76 protein [Xylaria sp. CBS 124048]|nr:glycoside hydrolase family 76 protein [Xylaria sp. CBS 124048]
MPGPVNFRLHDITGGYNSTDLRHRSYNHHMPRYQPIIAMVTSSFLGGLVARAALSMPASSSALLTTSNSYHNETVAAIHTLQRWYDQDTGLWNTTGWWNSANCLTMIADYAVERPQSASSLGLPRVIQNTYDEAQKTTVHAVKTINSIGLPVSAYVKVHDQSDISRRGYAHFLNDYYDDEGWWALALIRTHDVGGFGLGNEKYLQSAMDIFEDMKGGASKCGGIYWDKAHSYTNAIANELYLKVAASLANRVPAKKKNYYLDIAKKQWTWFNQSGLINSDDLINDGLTSDCKNNGMKTWSYNQGVILGALVELAEATADVSFIDKASCIASSAIAHLNKNGILQDGCEPNCGADGVQFKGVFMRNLRSLQQVAPRDEFRDFLITNADSIWTHDRNADNELGATWNGPYARANAGTQSSALDALVAALAVA